jgi:hypothetical protein
MPIDNQRFIIFGILIFCLTATSVVEVLKNCNNMKKFLAMMCAVALVMGLSTGFNAEAKVKKARRVAKTEKVAKKVDKACDATSECQEMKECDKAKAECKHDGKACDKAKAECKHDGKACDKAKAECKDMKDCEKDNAKGLGFKKMTPKNEKMGRDLNKKMGKGDCKDMKGDCNGCDKKGECDHKSPCCKEGPCKKDGSCGKEKCKANPEACCQ